jgi:hypothetical protein
VNQTLGIGLGSYECVVKQTSPVNVKLLKTLITLNTESIKFTLDSVSINTLKSKTQINFEIEIRKIPELNIQLPAILF